MEYVHAAEPDAEPAGPPTVEVVVFEGVDELDAVGPFEVLAAAGFAVRIVGFPTDLTAARGANGLTIGVEAPIGTPDVLVLPGGGGLPGTGPGVRELVVAGDLPRRVAELHAAGTVVATVCTGAFLAAAGGLLTGRPATTNRQALDDLERFGAVVDREARVVDDGDVLTAAGPLAGVDLAIRLVERYQGAEAAEQAAERLDHVRRGPLVVTEAPVG